MQLAVFGYQLEAVQCATDHQPQVGQINGFGDKVVGALAHRFDGGRDIAVGSKDDALGVGMLLADLFQ